MIQLIRPDLNVDFLSKSKPFVWFSTAAAIASLVGLFTVGLNYGIDFTGGAAVHLRAPKGWEISQVRGALSDAGMKDAHLVQLGEPELREYLVKVQAEATHLGKVAKEVGDAIQKKAGAERYEILKTDVVGPQAGESLRVSAFLSVLYAIVLIVAYITFRFDVRYAPGVIRALLVDVLITVGIWILIRREFNLTVLASFLTVAGYSCNDTIVIYDRIREYSTLHPNWDLAQSINRSINQNLGRTILTVLCTLFVVGSLYLFGGPVLEDFALPMLIGFTISIPSTIFVANPLILYMEQRRMEKLKRARVGA